MSAGIHYIQKIQQQCTSKKLQTQSIPSLVTPELLQIHDTKQFKSECYMASWGLFVSFLEDSP